MNTLLHPLQIVLERVAISSPATGAFFFWDEVQQWPLGGLDALVSYGMLQAAQPMTCLECDGCEQRCMMPVVVYPSQEGKVGRAFIVCDKDADMGRIRVSFDRLQQWHTNGGLIAAVLAKQLGLNPPANPFVIDTKSWAVGTLKGSKSHSPIVLHWGNGFVIALAGHSIPLVEVLTLEKHALVLDIKTLIRWVDNPADGNAVESASARRERLLARVREEKAKGTKAFNRVVAEEEGISNSRLKQLLQAPPLATLTQVEVEEDASHSNWSGLLSHVNQTSQKKPKSRY